jgi:orotidine-5'-phosphate decarboxylase
MNSENTLLEEARKRLIFALDVPDRKEAEKYVKLLEGSVGCFKVGLELFVKEGPQILKVVKDNSSADIFLDLKLHDIPATVRKALQSAFAHKVRFITVHSCEGLTMMKTAEDLISSGMEVLAVTVLTSLSEEELPSLGFKPGLTLHQLALDRAALAEKAGCAGVVCSGKEVAGIKEHCGTGFKVIVPGIRPSWSEVGKDDQSRITTSGQAIERGADMIVVGRPIRDAQDPKKAAARIVEEISEALNKK